MRAVVSVIQVSGQSRPHQCRTEITSVIVPRVEMTAAVVASVVIVGMAPLLFIAAVVVAVPSVSSQRCCSSKYKHNG